MNMNIRIKIILIVLPLIITALIITGAFSALSARNGLTSVAMKFLGFKSQELKKYADNQWNLLVTNNLSDKQDYVDVTKNAVESYARTLVRSATEFIFAIDKTGTIVLSTGKTALTTEEKTQVLVFYTDKKEGWVTFSLADKSLVGSSFYYEPFDWQFLVTEDQGTFYQEVTNITKQTGIILGGALVASVILLIIFANYLTNPLSKMVTTMRSIITTSDLSQRVMVEYQDEIGNLAHTFNIMITELEQAYKKIKEFAFRAVLAQKNEHKVRNIFQKYVPKDVIDRFFTNPESMLVGENRVVAILFSDIRSFTTISEGFMPDELVMALNKYFQSMVDIIMSRNGIIDKYIGDAIMAIFGAPVRHEDDAVQSVLAAIEMQQALTAFNQEQTAAGKPAFLTGIGINYGVVTVGNIGSEKKMDYTVIGDMVNLASRLEGLTKEYKQGLIFSESVYQKVKSTLPCRLVDKVQVKGKTMGEKIFTAKGDISESERDGWATYHKGLKYYFKQDFENALALFRQVDKQIPGDHIASLFSERCRNYLKNPPPPEWNGVEVMTHK